MVHLIYLGVIATILTIYEIRLRKLKREARKFHTLMTFARVRADALSHELWARRAKDSAGGCGVDENARTRSMGSGMVRRRALHELCPDQ